MDDIEKNTVISASPQDASPASSPATSPPRSLAESEVDEALAFLRYKVTAGRAVEVDEKKLLRRIDWMIVPLMWAVYLLQYLDKTLINYANVMGLQEDTHITAAQYSYLATVFYVSYLVCEMPQGYLMQRFPTAKYLGVQVILWGICVTMNCVCTNFASLVAVRVLLGMFEAAVAPGLLLITGMWYKKSEQPTRIGFWYLGTGTAIIVGAIASYGFQHYDGIGQTLKSWQIMFLVFGLLTIACGIAVFIYLPDNPMTSRLSDDEKLFAIERLRSNMTGIENKKFKVPQMMECLKDPHTWMLSLITVTANITHGAVSSFQTTIIKSLGYTSMQAALLSIPGGAVNIISILLATHVAGRTNTRALNIIALIIPSIIGGAMMAFLPQSTWPAGPLIGDYLTNSVGASLPLLYSWVSANFAGHTKKVTMNAILLMSFCLGNIIGPLTFTGYTAPSYIPAKVAIMATGCVAIAATLLLWWKYNHENRRRDQVYTSTAHVVDSEFMDLTDGQNKEFRYMV